MKKIFYLFLIPILWIGCSKETQPEPSPVGGTISVRSQGELSNEPQGAAEIPGKATTRTAGDVLTYTFEAWTRDGEPRRVLHKTANGTLREAAFEIALIPGNYDFLFWADYGKDAYTTDNLRQVIATEYEPASHLRLRPRTSGMQRRQRCRRHTHAPAGQTEHAEHHAIYRRRQTSLGYLPERPDAV